MTWAAALAGRAGACSTARGRSLGSTAAAGGAATTGGTAGAAAATRGPWLEGSVCGERPGCRPIHQVAAPAVPASRKIAAAAAQRRACRAPGFASTDWPRRRAAQARAAADRRSRRAPSRISTRLSWSRPAKICWSRRQLAQSARCASRASLPESVSIPRRPRIVSSARHGCAIMRAPPIVRPGGHPRRACGARLTCRGASGSTRYGAKPRPRRRSLPRCSPGHSACRAIRR